MCEKEHRKETAEMTTPLEKDLITQRENIQRPLGDAMAERKRSKLDMTTTKDLEEKSGASKR